MTSYATREGYSQSINWRNLLKRNPGKIDVNTMEQMAEDCSDGREGICGLLDYRLPRESDMPSNKQIQGLNTRFGKLMQQALTNQQNGKTGWVEKNKTLFSKATQILSDMTERTASIVSKLKKPSSAARNY